MQQRHEGAYFTALISAEAKTVTVYLRKETGALKVVGVERSW